MAKLIFTNGTTTEIKNPTLEDLQNAVKGYIEAVAVGKQVMYVNEEGRLIGLPRNSLASVMTGQDIVGDVILLSEEETKKDMG